MRAGRDFQSDRSRSVRRIDENGLPVEVWSHPLASAGGDDLALRDINAGASASARR
jgi:hypothetical protein